MTNIGWIITFALAVVGGITLCILLWVFILNLHELFERVDELEEVVRKHGLAIRGMKNAAD